MLKRYLNDESGQAMSEYGLIIAAVGVVIIGLIAAFKTEIKNAFIKSTDALKEANKAA